MIGTVISCAAAAFTFGLWLGQRIHRRDWAKVADAIDALEDAEVERDAMRVERDQLLDLLLYARRRVSLPADLLSRIAWESRRLRGGGK